MLVVLPEVSKSKTPRELTNECIGVAIGECTLYVGFVTGRGLRVRLRARDRPGRTGVVGLVSLVGLIGVDCVKRSRLRVIERLNLRFGRLRLRGEKERWCRP
jgi:hypothetical protein